MIIVESSVLINLFRGKTTKSVAMFKRIEAECVPFAIPAICCQEILQGAKNQKEWDLLAEYLSYQEIAYDWGQQETYWSAANIYFTLRRKGRTVRSTVDCLIAQLVLEIENGRLLHDDRDFLVIAKYFPLAFV